MCQCIQVMFNNASINDSDRERSTCSSFRRNPLRRPEVYEAQWRKKAHWTPLKLEQCQFDIVNDARVTTFFTNENAEHLNR